MTTVEKAIAIDTERKAISSDKIRVLLADANNFVGQEAFESEIYDIAHKYSAESLKYRWYQPRAILIYLITYLPNNVVANIKDTIQENEKTDFLI